MSALTHNIKLKLAPLALLAVAASWGFAFLVMKDAIERQSVNSFLFSRFTLAVVVMVGLKPSVLKKLDRDLIFKGGIAGFFLGSGYIFQTMGLARTGIAVTGFITGLYVITAPLLAAVFLKVKITKFTWFCVGLATFGLALLSLNGWSIGTGEFFVLLSAFCFGAHIVSLSQWSNGRDAYSMTVVQLAACALLSGIFSFAEGFQAPPDFGVWSVIIFTATICTALAFIVQTWAQAHISATKVAVILTMEVVFAAFFAILLYGERLTFKIALGGAIVVAAMFLLVVKEKK